MIEQFNFDIRLIFAILNGKVSAAINRKLYRNFRQNGLEISPEQWTVLIFLWEKDGVTQQELCNATFKDKPSMTRLIDNMERQHLVVRISDKKDRRTNLIHLTRTGKELEEKEKTPAQKTAEAIIMILPLLCGCIAMAEYVILPNNSRNSKPWSYVWVLGAAMCIYLVCFIVSLIRRARGEKQLYEKLRYKAPRYAALFIFLAVYDYLTLKTGTLTQPFVPCMNYIINAFLVDYKMLADCTLNTLKLLFIGYSIGVTLGLITGIACGYSKKARYWLDPIIKFLGPIPTSTWIPIIMVVATSLFGGAVFIIALGSWFAVTVASLTGISNVGKEYFEAARTLGATNRQLVLHVAIPHAMPSILQGCTQAMSSSCVAIMIAEMLGVKSGLGWYMTWQTGWASYDKSFAALFVICFIFTLVTNGLERIKRYLLRWQNGAEK